MKIFNWPGQGQNKSCESLKNNKLICRSRCRRNLTNDLKVTRHNQVETVLSDDVSCDTPESTITSNFNPLVPDVH